MKAIELRNKYLEFFKSKEHSIISGARLVPENDPTVLFTTAGMQPLVPYLMGETHPYGTRLCDYQKCIRTNDLEEIADYRMKYSGNDNDGTLIIKMRTREKGVLDSLRDGSLAWFANKARYEYFKAAKANFLIGSSEGMKEKLEGTFSGGFDSELVEFLDWYITERGKSIWTKELYAEYIDWHSEASEGTLMSERAFARNLAKAIRTCVDKGHKVEMRKTLNDKRMSLNKLFIGDEVIGES